MRPKAKRKHKLLQEFTKIMFDHNPMALPQEGNPGAADEYESEALSVLSRFNEGALHMCEDENLQREVACGMVRQCFEFWFNTSNITEPEKLAFALLDAYKSAYPRTEQPAPVEVPSEA